MWVFEPVKYWQAEPKKRDSTTRRSTCSPRPVSTEVRVSPRPSTSVTVGSSTKASITTVGCSDTHHDVDVSDGLGHAAQAAAVLHLQDFR